MNSDNWVRNIYARINTFKKALKELAFLEEDIPVKLKFSMIIHTPKLFIMNGIKNNFVITIKFVADSGGVRCTNEWNLSKFYTIGGIRLAFS